MYYQCTLLIKTLSSDNKMQTLSRDELAAALEYWMKLPFSVQLEEVVICSQAHDWPLDVVTSEIRHWMTMISSKEQISLWGPSLYGTTPELSEKDGDRCMTIVEHAWRNRRKVQH